MKARFPLVVLLLVSVALYAVEHKSAKSVEQLKAEADAAHGGHQARLCAEVAMRLVDAAAEQFGRDEITQGQATIQQVVVYATKAHDASLASRSKQKEVEINLRETQRRLQNLKHTLAADDRPPLEAAEKTISDLRQEIQDEMFGVKKKKEEKNEQKKQEVIKEVTK
jgi:hypothetical protein